MGGKDPSAHIKKSLYIEYIKYVKNVSWKAKEEKRKPNS